MQGASYKFGNFELDPDRFELRRNGTPAKLERIPMELLILLVEKDGAVVSRQEIVERLWGKDVFVDTEHGINTAIRKIRTVLKEDAERPRFVQTVPGKGYRFVAEVTSGATDPAEAPAAKAAEPAAKAGRRWSPWNALTAGVMAAVLIAAGLGVWHPRKPKGDSGKIQSIAVLPLANLSGDASQDYFADGLTDELITMLAKKTTLHVVSRTSAMQYKGLQRPLSDVARELRADCILEGSTSRVGDRVHVTVQLIHGADDSHIWADSYDRDMRSVFALPAEVALIVGHKLGAAVSDGAPQRYASPDAHDNYLRGRYFWYTNKQDRSMEYFKQAVELQPDYAAAWSGLGDSYIVRGVAGTASAQDIRDRAANAVHRAIELDDASAEAHLSLAAYYLFLEWNWKMAEVESRRAIDLNSQFAEAYHLRSYVFMAMNRPEEALAAQARSTELDPFARPWALGHAYISLRQYDAAINELLLRRDVRPEEAWPHYSLSRVYWFKGNEKEWVSELEEGLRLENDKKGFSKVKLSFRQGGPAAIKNLFLRDDLAQQKRGYFSPLKLALDYALLGRKEETLAMLEAAYRERSPMLVFLQFDPEFDFVHDEPRYRKIVGDMSMDPAY